MVRPVGMASCLDTVEVLASMVHVHVYARFSGVSHGQLGTMRVNALKADGPPCTMVRKQF